MSEQLSGSPSDAQPGEITYSRSSIEKLGLYASLGKLLVRTAVEGVAAMYADNRIKAADDVKPLDVKILNRLASRKLTSQTNAAPGLFFAHEQNALQEVGSVYSNVWRWHGTGRYEYQSSDEITDVLQQIIHDGGLVPHLDTIDVATGPMRSISTARSRMYARPYADMHNDRNQTLSWRYGKPSTWGRYFMAPVMVEGFIEAALWRREARQKVRAGGLQGLRKWRAKVNQAPYTQRLYEALDEGSDIAGNYPVLIGLGDGAFDEAPLAQTLQRHESRSTAGIPIDSFTHLEVPEANIEETRRLLKANGVARVPVIPIEMGEYYCSKLEFSELVSWRQQPSHTK